MTEINSFEKIITGLKFTEIKFPCGLEINTTKEILSNYKKIVCPLHGKQCINKSIKILKQDD